MSNVTSPAEVEARFLELFDSVRPRIEYIARRARGEDPENLVAEARARCWSTFRARYQQEQAALAAGRSSPHKWPALFCRITHSLVVSEYRDRQDRYRGLGTRLTREPFSAERSFGLISPGKGAGAGISALPVDCDFVVDDSVRPTEDIVARREAAALLHKTGFKAPGSLSK